MRDEERKGVGGRDLGKRLSSRALGATGGSQTHALSPGGRWGDDACDREWTMWFKSSLLGLTH